MPDIEYGIASPSRPGDIEPLGPVSRRTAEAVIADSRTVWTDVHLVQRVGSGEWTETDECADTTGRTT